MPDLIAQRPAVVPPKKKEKLPKGPSKFFTEYYGPAFLFLVAAFILAAYFVLRPVLNDIKQTNAQTSAQIVMINGQRSYLQSLQRSVAAAQTIPATTLGQVDRALPDISNVPSLLVQFGSAAASTNVRIDSLDFAEAAPVVQTTAPAPNANPITNNPQIHTIDINLVLHASSYFDVKRFLSDVETSLRLMDVLGITASGAGNQVTYSLQLRAYSFVPPNAPTTK